jgi:uncharacterized protein
VKNRINIHFMKATKASIKAFLESRKIAIAGVSRDEKKFGYAVMTQFKKMGIEPYLVHPEANIMHGEMCYHNVSLLPDDVNALLIITPKTSTLGVVEDAVKKGIKNIWIQQMSETPESIQLAVDNNLNLVIKQCIFMFADPVESVHKFHRNIKKFFGLLPK